MSNKTTKQREADEHHDDTVVEQPDNEQREVASEDVELVDEQHDEHEAGQADQDVADELAEDLADGAEEQEVAEPDPVAQLQAECQALKAQLLRERADFDNIRKRLRREAEEAGQRAVVRFARPMLTQLDNFSLALEAANPEAFQDFAMGVTMIRDGLLQVLDETGITPVATDGPFDPKVHEVLAEVPSELPKGHIVSVQRTGYHMAGNLVRAAQVLVSSGQAPAAATNDDADSA